MSILKNKSKLKHPEKHIYINLDLTNNEKEVQMIIRTIAREERSEGNQTRIGFKK